MTKNEKKVYLYQLDEARWIDSIVRSLYPKWLTKLAEKRLTFLQPLIVKFAKLRVESSKHMTSSGPNQKGFRNGFERIDHIITKIYRSDKLIAEKKFDLNIILK